MIFFSFPRTAVYRQARSPPYLHCFPCEVGLTKMPPAQLPLEQKSNVLCLRFHLPVGYPETALPEIEASSSRLSREEHTALCAIVRQSTESAELLGRECVFEIVQMINDATRELLDQSPVCETHKGEHGRARQESSAVPNANTVNVDSDECQERCCLKLDHMRDEQRYIKTIRGWIRNLGLRGRCVCVCVCAQALAAHVLCDSQNGVHSWLQTFFFRTSIFVLGYTT